MVTDCPGHVDEESEFDFAEGDHVCVRVREHGTSGSLVAKFVGECSKIETFPTGRTQATIELPGTFNSAAYAPYEADFERVDSRDEVNF